MTENTNLVSGILVEQFKMDIMVPQRAMELPKKSEVIHFAFLVTFPKEVPETTNKTDGRDGTDILV